jgi:hypothetical protein
MLGSWRATQQSTAGPFRLADSQQTASRQPETISTCGHSRSISQRAGHAHCMPHVSGALGGCRTCHAMYVQTVLCNTACCTVRRLCNSVSLAFCVQNTVCYTLLNTTTLHNRITQAKHSQLCVTQYISSGLSNYRGEDVFVCDDALGG